MKDNKINKRLLEMLEDTCGASCCHTNEKCECFGPLSNEAIEDLGITREEADDNIFYRKEDCSYYSDLSWSIIREGKHIESKTREILGDSFPEEAIVKYVDFFKENGGNFAPYIFRIAIDIAINSISHETDERKQCVYLVCTSHGVKIGATKNPEIRTKIISNQAQFETKDVRVFEVENMFKTEKLLHNRYEALRTNGEWFDLSQSQIEDITAMLS